MAYINGFLSSPSPSAIGLRTYTVPGTSVRLSVRSDIAPLLIGAAAAYNQRVQRLHVGWNWGYAYRLVRGGTTPSFHSAGIAIDLNAPAHPIGTSPSANYSAAQIAQCRAIARQFGLRWGGDYSGRKDGMHFEVILPHAAAVALARRIQGGGGGGAPIAPPKPAGPPGTPFPGTLRSGMTSHSVLGLQHRLVNIGAIRVVQNSHFDAVTLSAVRSFQQRHHMAVDGVVGPATWQAIFAAGAKF